MFFAMNSKITSHLTVGEIKQSIISLIFKIFRFLINESENLMSRS